MLQGMCTHTQASEIFQNNLAAPGTYILVPPRLRFKVFVRLVGGGREKFHSQGISRNTQVVGDLIGWLSHQSLIFIIIPEGGKKVVLETIVRLQVRRGNALKIFNWVSFTV